MTAYLSLDFTQNVKIPDVLRVLKNAAEGNGFGDFQVDPGSIQAISEEQLPTDPPSTTVGTTMSGTAAEPFVSLAFLVCFLFLFFLITSGFINCFSGIVSAKRKLKFIRTNYSIPKYR